MKYNTVCPYFYPEDIEEILGSFRKILSGDGLLSMGPHVREFELRFAAHVGTKYAVAMNSCTSALELCLLAIGVKAGDEIVVPVQTFFASGSCVSMLNATPVFCDTDENFLLDFDCLKRAITPKTKAVILVYYAGLIHPRIFEIRDYLHERGIILIEDAAHAHGARIDGLQAGSIGELGCYSFFSTKIMTTGEGGMVTTSNEEYALRIASLRNRGMDPTAGYEIFTNIGGNRRMTEVQALLGLQQLKRLGEFVAQRNRIAATYCKALSVLAEKELVRFQNYERRTTHAYWRFVVFIQSPCIRRDDLRDRMRQAGIKIDWPYEPLIHLQPIFRRLRGTTEGMFQTAERLSKTHFCLPMHYGISEQDAKFIAANLIEAFDA